MHILPTASPYRRIFTLLSVFLDYLFSLHLRKLIVYFGGEVYEYLPLVGYFLMDIIIDFVSGLNFCVNAMFC